MIDSVETSRLLLRPIIVEDIQALHSILGDDPDMSWEQKPQPIQHTMQILQKELKHYKINGFGVWGVFFKDSGEIVGKVGLKSTINLNKVELVVFIAKRLWGQGIAFEACTGALKYGFSELELDRIIANTRINNYAAQKLLKNLKFNFLKKDVVYNFDVYTYELLWEKFKPKKSVYIIHRFA